MHHEEYFRIERLVHMVLFLPNLLVLLFRTGVVKLPFMEHLVI